jgi:hypothetical protein
MLGKEIWSSSGTVSGSLPEDASGKYITATVIVQYFRVGIFDSKPRSQEQKPKKLDLLLRKAQITRGEVAVQCFSS